MALLEVKDLKKSFGKTEVLKGITFSLEKGQVLALSALPAAVRPRCCVV